MPVSVGPYGQAQPSCFDRVKMGFMMGFAVGMAAGAMFGTFSCLRQVWRWSAAQLLTPVAAHWASGLVIGLNMCLVCPGSACVAESWWAAWGRPWCRAGARLAPSWPSAWASAAEEQQRLPPQLRDCSESSSHHSPPPPPCFVNKRSHFVKWPFGVGVK